MGLYCVHNKLIAERQGKNKMKKLTRKQKIDNIKKAFIENNNGKGYQHFFKDNTQGDFNEAPSNTQYHDYAIVSYLDDNYKGKKEFKILG